MNQRNEFASDEGDAWFQRNFDALSRDDASDPVPKILKKIDVNPRRVLEVGSANGWRLDLMRKSFGSSLSCSGIDPSSSAINDGLRRYSGLDLRLGFAHDLPFADSAFDVVIFGHCLYICDPREHFAIVAEADRVLSDTGFLVIVEFNTAVPFRNPYRHKAGHYSYKMDWSRMFCGHPAYSLIHREYFAPRPDIGNGGLNPNHRHAIDVIYKDIDNAFPDNPFETRL